MTARDDIAELGMCVCRLAAALDMIALIAEGSRTINSLPHIAKIARKALEVEGAAIAPYHELPDPKSPWKRST
jgi:hypothetical protein